MSRGKWSDVCFKFDVNNNDAESCITEPPLEPATQCYNNPPPHDETNPALCPTFFAQVMVLFFCEGLSDRIIVLWTFLDSKSCEAALNESKRKTIYLLLYLYWIHKYYCCSQIFNLLNSKFWGVLHFEVAAGHWIKSNKEIFPFK